MKEKYYPLADFMEAQLGRRPSFVWSSIIKARPLVQNGVGWRVGNGENIKIWGDAWLPPPHVRLLPTCHSGFHYESRVSLLIDPLTGWWNLDLVCDIVDPNESVRIGSVMLSPLN
jgi:hypothetical protein